MKKWIRLTLPLFLIPSISIPLALTITSCANINNMDLRIYDENAVGKTFNELDKCNVKLKDLLYGDKGFNDGNYVLIIAHSDYYSSRGNKSDNGYNDFLFGSTAPTWDDSAIPKFPADSVAQRALDESDYKETNTKIVLCYSIDKTWWNDDLVSHDTSNPDALIKDYTPISPYEKHTDADYAYDDSYTSGDYIRNDQQAKDWRETFRILNSIYSVESDEATFGFALQWCKGYPMIGDDTSGINSTGWTTTSNFVDFVHKNYETALEYK